jgi:hypothetical protein
MWGRAWVSVLLMATLTGCASRSRPKASLPSLNIPLECASGIRLVNLSTVTSLLTPLIAAPLPSPIARAASE